jgi:DNA-binding HxlR family transcriptional regulator
MASEDCTQDQRRYRARSLALQDALELLSGKWKVRLLLTLHNYGAMRFKDLQTAAAGISPKVLSKELQELEDNLLLTRTVNPTKPITVSYALTPHALEAEPVINALVAFGLTHRSVLVPRQEAPEEPTRGQ